MCNILMRAIAEYESVTRRCNTAACGILRQCVTEDKCATVNISGICAVGSKFSDFMEYADARAKIE